MRQYMHTLHASTFKLHPRLEHMTLYLISLIIPFYFIPFSLTSILMDLLLKGPSHENNFFTNGSRKMILSHLGNLGPRISFFYSNFIFERPYLIYLSFSKKAQHVLRVGLFCDHRWANLSGIVSHIAQHIIWNFSSNRTLILCLETWDIRSWNKKNRKFYKKHHVRKIPSWIIWIWM